MPNVFPKSRTLPPPRHVTPQRGRETLEEHWAAQNAIDLAAHKRRHQEEWGAALLEAEDAPDEKSRRGIFERAASRVTTIDAEVPEVRNAYAQYVESAMPYWTDRFARQAKDIRDQLSHDRGMAEYNAAVDEKDVEGAVKALTLLSAVERENAVKYGQMEADLPFTIALRGVARAVSSGDAGNIGEATDALRGMALEGLSTEQVVARRKALDVADRQLDEVHDGALIELLLDADKAANLPPAERDAEFERIKAAAGPLLMTMTPAETRATINWFDAQARGEPSTVDPRAEIEANRIVRGLDANMTTQEFADAEKRILGLMPRLGPKTVDYIRELDTRLDRFTKNAIEDAVNKAEARGQIDPAYAVDMRRALEKEIHRQKDAMSPADIVEYGAQVAVTLPAPEPERVLGPDAADKLRNAAVIGGVRTVTAGMLDDNGEYEDDTGVYGLDDTIRWRNAWEAYKHARLTVGPGWAEECPAVRDQWVRYWPVEFYHYLDDEEKRALFEQARKIELPSEWRPRDIGFYVGWLGGPAGAVMGEKIGRALEGELPLPPGGLTWEDVEAAQDVPPGDLDAWEARLEENGALLPKELPSPPPDVEAELGPGPGMEAGFAGMDDGELAEAYEQARTAAEKQAIYDEAQRRKNFGGTFAGGVP
jgi:hypothetical protein